MEEKDAVPLNGSPGHHPGHPCEACGGSEYLSLKVISPAPPSMSPPPAPPMLAASMPVPMSPTADAPEDGWLLMKGAAAKMRRSYHWFSRSWRKMGLRPSAGRPLLFREEEIEAYLQRHRVRPRGRPRIT